MGVGMVALVDEGAADGAVGRLTEAGVPAWVCGSVTDEPGGTTRLVGRYAA